MPTPINTARQVLAAHGFTVNNWSGRYCIRRDIPPYGMRCPEGKGFHRDWRGFHASEVPLSWVRRLADALALADASRVTSSNCADAWAANRKAETARDEARVAHHAATSYRRPDFTLTEQLDLGLAELKATGAAKVAQLIAQLLLEDWQQRHPIADTLAAIDRGRQPLALS